MNLFKRKDKPQESDGNKKKETPMQEMVYNTISSLIGSTFFTFIDGKVMEVILQSTYQDVFSDGAMGFFPWDVIVVDGHKFEHRISQRSLSTTIKDCLKNIPYSIPDGKAQWYIQEMGIGKGEYIYDMRKKNFEIPAWQWNGREAQEIVAYAIKGIGIDGNGIYLTIDDTKGNRKNIRKGETLYGKEKGVYKTLTECYKNGVITLVDKDGNEGTLPEDTAFKLWITS